MSSLPKRFFSASTLLALALLFTGCGKKELYNQVEERQANEMIAILARHSIDAEKTTGKEGMFNVMVEGQYFGEAVEILDDYGYPEDHFTGIGEVFKKSGLVSSPAEERIRYMYALSQDLQETLSLISGVLNARVHVVIPNNDPLADQIYPSSAAVFIKYRRNSGVENLTPQIKNLVVKSIEGLDYANVSLSLFPVQENDISAPAGEIPLVDPMRSQADDTMLITLIIVFVVVAMSGTATAFLFSRKKQEAAAPAQAAPAQAVAQQMPETQEQEQETPP